MRETVAADLRPPTRLTQRLYILVVLPRLEYSLSVWYSPVRDRPSGKGQCGSVGVAWQCDKLNRVAARLIAGGFKTTSTDMLVYHADLLPTTIRLNKAAHSAAVRLATLPTSLPLQPLVARAACRQPRLHKSLLHELFAAFPDIRGLEVIYPVMQSPDTSSLFTTRIVPSKDATIRNVARYHRRYVNLHRRVGLRGWHRCGRGVCPRCNYLVSARPPGHPRPAHGIRGRAGWHAARARHHALPAAVRATRNGPA